METEKCRQKSRTDNRKKEHNLLGCQLKSASFSAVPFAFSFFLFFLFLLSFVPILFVASQDSSFPMLLTVGLLGQKGVAADQLLTMANQRLHELNLTNRDVYKINVQSFDMSSSDCQTDVGIANGSSQAMDLLFGSNVSALFGPICSDDLSLTVRVTSSLDILQCNFWRPSWANTVTDHILDMSTMAPDNMATNILALLQMANWRKIALITCPQCYSRSDQGEVIAEKLGQKLTEQGIKLVEIVRLDRTNGTLNTATVVERMGPVKNKARILLTILGNSLNDYVLFLRTLIELGMDKSEYLPIVCIGLYSPTPLALPWLSNGTLHSAMLDLFHGTILLVNEFYPNSQVISFGTQIGADQSENSENVAEGERPLLMHSVQLYECFWTYALLLWRTFQNTGGVQGNRNGTLLRSNIGTATIQGPFGPITLDAKFNRVAPFRAYFVESNATDQPRPGLLQFANISFSCLNGTSSNCQTLNATALQQQFVLQFPPDVPICGFQGELCDQRGTIIVAVSVMVAICLGFIIFICIRKVKRGETTQMPYYVSEQMLAFVDMDYGGSSNISIHSFHQHLARREKEEQRTDEFSDEIYSRKIATIDQSFVIVESFRLREKLSFDKKDTQLLFMMKQSVHDNINAFIGLCVERPTDVWVIWRHCFRGTLADLLFINSPQKVMDSRVDDDIYASVASITSAHQAQRGAGGERAMPRRDILDNNFKSAFVRDIVKGLDFLHSSSIGYHGTLTSTHCFIDSHWILKLSGFGISRLLFKWRHNGILSNGNGTVIQPLIPNDELHYYAPELRSAIRSAVIRNKPEEMEFTNEEGQAQDMYAFGAILYEILYRRRIVDGTHSGDGVGPLEPMEDDVGIFSAQAEERLPIVPEFPGEESATANSPRSAISSIDRVHPDLVALMRRCFGTADQRPDANMARKITDATLKMSGSLVDQMIKNMEQYTGNLENMVKEQTGKLELEQQKIEQILLELLPKSVVDELRLGRRVEPQFYASVTIMYSDIVGFTSLCSESQPMEVVNLLNGMFRYFDQAISEHKAYKVETIGDAYMVASGIPERLDSHIREIAAIALMQREFLFDYEIPHRPGQHLHCRWGFNSGSVFTGVVGITAPRYCVFGSTVTLAAKMENSGHQDRIQMTLKSYQLLSEEFPEFRCSPRGGVRLEGVGTLLTYWLDGFDSGGVTSDRSASEGPTEQSVVP